MDTLKVCSLMVPFSLYLMVPFFIISFLTSTFNFRTFAAVYPSILPPSLTFLLLPKKVIILESSTGERIHGEGRHSLVKKVSKVR